MAEIKLITKDTDIDSLKMSIINWDIVINDVPYYVAHIEGYVHSIGGKWGENNMWAFPRNEKPSYENLVEFTANNIVNWGLEYKEKYYLKSKWDECEVRQSSGTMITRNGKEFYFVRGSMDYSLARARAILTKIQEGPLNVFEIDFDKKLVGRHILYKGIPAVIEMWISGQGCIIASYCGPDKYKNLIPKIWGCEEESEISVKLDVIGYNDFSIDWFPEYREDNEMKLSDIFDKYFDLKEERND